MGNELTVQTKVREGLDTNMNECDSGDNPDQVAKELGDLLSKIRSEINLPKIPVDTEQLSERAKKRLTRRAFRNNNFIKTYPEKKSMISLLFNLNTNKETYLYTRRYGYVSLVEIPTSTL